MQADTDINPFQQGSFRDKGCTSDTAMLQHLGTYCLRGSCVQWIGNIIWNFYKKKNSCIYYANEVRHFVFQSFCEKMPKNPHNSVKLAQNR